MVFRLLPTRVKEQWKSVPTYPMWYTCLIRHSRVVLNKIEMRKRQSLCIWQQISCCLGFPRDHMGVVAQLLP